MENIYLELDNGIILTGKSFGYSNNKKPLSGELVFQTGITGYMETITDPSYANQFLVFTTPLINNYGVPNSNIDSKMLILFLSLIK